MNIVIIIILLLYFIIIKVSVAWIIIQAQWMHNISHDAKKDYTDLVHVFNER